MDRSLLLVCSVALLTACTTLSYSKVDATPQQFAADQAQCNTQANGAALGTDGWTGVAIFAQNKRMCMVGKGYTAMCDGQPCNPQY